MVIGTLGKDAVVNDVNGKKVINFSVAHSERYKDAQGNQQEKTIWIDVARWGEQTGVAQYLNKGTKVWLEGIPEVRTYQAGDGSTKATLTIRATQIELLGGAKPEGGSNASGYVASPPPQVSQQASVVDAIDDDLPF